MGTASNYFPTRAALIGALVERIGQRLAPDPDVVARLSAQPPSKRTFGDFVRYIVERLTTQRDVTLALFELRLEAARRPDVGAALTDWRQAGFDDDVEFNNAAGLPGGPTGDRAVPLRARRTDVRPTDHTDRPGHRHRRDRVGPGGAADGGRRSVDDKGAKGGVPLTPETVCRFLAEVASPRPAASSESAARPP
ncbi:TetR/AcrR family transcriptional regulator [Gordonia asplenii]|uniref:TetR/AcrR family transcriptional regulator n=1 Tax=Gordonia asplenii TaxID=2725283 RepID=UPI001FEAE4D2|nr:hypothetical protein [Gordonia asplenii]